MERRTGQTSLPPAALTTARARRVAVVEVDDAVRLAMERLLSAPQAGEAATVTAFSDADEAWSWLKSNRVDLVLAERDQPRLPGPRLVEALRRLPWGNTLGIVLVGNAYNDVLLGAAECKQCGADAYLPLPATPALVETRLSEALAQREPLESLGVLPLEKARFIDALFERLDRFNYYELFGVPMEADEATLREAFHRLSVELHPDRHGRLRRLWPHAFNRINHVYKRINEAWRVLMDPGLRARYHLGLHQRGDLRLTKSRQSRREEKELALCRSEGARQKVAQSLDLRSVGDLEGAERPLIEACTLEPDNTELAQVLAAVRKLLDIMRRG